MCSVPTRVENLCESALVALVLGSHSCSDLPTSPKSQRLKRVKSFQKNWKLETLFILTKSSLFCIPFQKTNNIQQLNHINHLSPSPNEPSFQWVALWSPTKVLRCSPDWSPHLSGWDSAWAARWCCASLGPSRWRCRWSKFDPNQRDCQWQRLSSIGEWFLKDLLFRLEDVGSFNVFRRHVSLFQRQWQHVERFHCAMVIASWWVWIKFPRGKGREIQLAILIHNWLLFPKWIYNILTLTDRVLWMPCYELWLWDGSEHLPHLQFAWNSPFQCFTVSWSFTSQHRKVMVWLNAHQGRFKGRMIRKSDHGLVSILQLRLRSVISSCSKPRMLAKHKAFGIF